ncbi:MAG: SGNH/GDSL hydrolase family protein [Clostridiales bacterium]|nr:SGNH/GDSL hydrolase family protein [Clostridiales bacterium]
MTFYNVRNLSYLLKQDCSVVITGDSLAYNRYDFVEEPRMNAWDCPFSMKSWSFLLRDYLISHSLGWTPACELELESTNLDVTLFKKHNERVPYSFQLPLEDQGIVLNTTDDSKMKIKGCLENNCFITHPTKGALFDVADQEVNLIGTKDLFGGLYYKWIKWQSDIIVNVKKGSFVQFLGTAKTKTEVFLTGSGSKTVEWLLENSHERITRFNPNLCIMIIGANNRRMNDPKSFKAALYELIKKLNDEKCEILLISPPHSSTTDPQWNDDYIYQSDKVLTKPILDILRKAALEFDLPYMDLFEFFSGVPNKKWRFDNTHFTKEGNLMLFEAIIDKYFKE